MRTDPPKTTFERTVILFIAGCLLASGATFATAITKRTPAADFTWSQSSNFVKLPFGGGFEEALY